GKSSQPQMNADNHGYSMRCLYSPTHQKGEWPRCVNGMIHLLSSAFICVHLRLKPFLGSALLFGI
ncbi:MAG TPA: hypothetical protein VJ437_07585, partial [Acidiferrobacterales bacterium]|nr:hypothetical protein [Acidiferrobacterales bacterium]